MDDTRWRQRFRNYLRAFRSLDGAVDLARTRPLSDLEKQGLIQSFEFTHELGWNVLKDYLEEKGITGLIGSKDSTRTAFRNGLLADGEAWMKMIADRNLTSHTYDAEVAQSVVDDILERFHPAFQAMVSRFSALMEVGEAR